MSEGPAAARPIPASVAHELRSSLNGIKSWAHVLENELRGADPLASRAIAGILDGVEQQVRIIESLEATLRTGR